MGLGCGRFLSLFSVYRFEIGGCSRLCGQKKFEIFNFLSVDRTTKLRIEEGRASLS